MRNAVSLSTGLSTISFWNRSSRWGRRLPAFCQRCCTQECRQSIRQCSIHSNGVSAPWVRRVVNLPSCDLPILVQERQTSLQSKFLPYQPKTHRFVSPQPVTIKEAHDLAGVVECSRSLSEPRARERNRVLENSGSSKPGTEKEQSPGTFDSNRYNRPRYLILV